MNDVARRSALRVSQPLPRTLVSVRAWDTATCRHGRNYSQNDPYPVVYPVTANDGAAHVMSTVRLHKSGTGLPESKSESSNQLGSHCIGVRCNIRPEKAVVHRRGNVVPRHSDSTGGPRSNLLSVAK